MKTLKIMVCAFLVLCGSIFFAACGKKQNVDFDAANITIGTIDEFTYDGNSHAVTVSYNGVNANVTYALESDKNNFMPASSLPTVNAGNYKLYYRLSAEGYNDYTSSGTISMTVLPRELEIIMDDYIWIKSNPNNNLNVGYATVGLINNDDVGFSVNYGSDFDKDTAQLGEEYDIVCSITNPNYTLIATPAKMYVKDLLQINDTEGNFKAYYSNFNDALEHAEAGEAILLNSDAIVDRAINIDKDVIIDGQGKYTIIASTDYNNDTYASKELATLFKLDNANAKLTLKDVTLNGSQTVRLVSAFQGKVVVDGATITNGKKTDRWRSGGVFITSKASFEMTNGTITGNNANDTEYTKYCADLWIGANAIGSLVSITGGKVGNVFVNSNSYSANDAGKFVLDGGEISNIYVEYDSGYGAKFEYITGDILNLFISLKNDNGNYYGVAHKLTPVENTVYVGGKLVYEETSKLISSRTFDENIDEVLVDGNDYIFENCTFNAPISSTRKVSIVFNDCTFNSSSVNGETMLYLTSVINLVVANCTFTGNITNSYAIDLNLYSTTCEDVVIANNIFNTISTENSATISVKTRLGETDHPTDAWAEGEIYGEIDGLVLIAGNDFAENSNMICIGVDPQGNSTTANTSTGDFDVLVTKNLDALTIYNMFKDHAHVEEDEVSKFSIQQGALYDSTLEQ